MSNFSIRQFISDPDNNRDSCWNFYDWFCKDNSLERRARSFIPKLKFLVKEGILDPDNLYAWFKNNCPCVGNLYDDVRISTIDDDNRFLGGFCPRSGHANRRSRYSWEEESKETPKLCTVWWFENQEASTENLIERKFETWSDFKRELKSNPEFRSELKKAFNPGVPVTN